MAELSKYPILASCVDNPPMAIAEKLWLMASNKLIPANQNALAHAMVRLR